MVERDLAGFVRGANAKEKNAYEQSREKIGVKGK
jgi:hypothetical protein